ncbi:glutamate 5-kinase [Pedobacter yulinensis]|uniref:Glutamate 5-kinase n=1 Tax=Pedobacter yulinensis TaxID=2126353 RepID=A0A2T3HS50_9SPHI|nr:glutamate 5-kinase [Pedobacter yulinensis]PST85249.1 glutamate 5-kinase [Pedobacter yulinensis]
MKFPYRKIVVKIGSNVITQDDGLPDHSRIKDLVDQVAVLRASGLEVVLVSSGAVASGRSIITVAEKQNAVAARQLLASIGQVKLINTYAALFEAHGINCAQVLVTKEDFRDRLHYLNMKNCLQILLQHQVVPIINENDVVSVTELMFTDNDELAGLVAAMLGADALVILSNVNGIYTGDPKSPDSRLLEEISGSTAAIAGYVTTGKSQFGRGGMLTKASMAAKTASLGIPVHITNGKTDNVLPLLLAGKLAHTRFATEKRASNKKKWIAHSENAASGTVQVNEGAKLALTCGRASSLLPVGITAVLSGFQKGDIIRVVDERGQTVGLGIAEYGADKAKERIGQKNQRPLVHYDYFYASN